MHNEKVLLKLVVNLVKLCSIPTVSWDEEDRKHLQEARDYLRDHESLDDLAEGGDKALE